MIRNLEIVLLSKLSEQPSTGYGLSKLLQQSPWKASHQQVYRSLLKLEQNLMVESTVIVQESKPDKKCYSITDRGRDALMSPELLFPRIKKMQDEANAMLFLANPKYFKNLYDNILRRIEELEIQKQKVDPLTQLSINREMRLLVVDAEWCREVIAFLLKESSYKGMAAA